jgi:cell division protein FtsW
MKVGKINRAFLSLVLIITLVGFLSFLSASLGKIGQDISVFSQIVLKQFLILILSLGVLFLVANINYKIWRHYALFIFVISILLTLLIMIPGFGIKSGGAARWLKLGSFSFQPAEILKYGFVFYWAGWLASAKTKIKKFQWGMLPLLTLLGLTGSLLYFQPDTGTLIVVVGTGVIMYFVAGCQWRDLGILLLIGSLAFSVMAFHRPYLKDRLLTYFNPTQDLLGASYQVNQSLIAIGAGGIYGRGFGQSTQKFSFLPQPMSDSIFSVTAEEFGFIGAVIILLLFLSFTVLGLRIAIRAPDIFGRLLAVGIVILITVQSFINIGSMLALLPLTGLPLIFFSQGGSALLLSFFGVGIILNISRYC